MKSIINTLNKIGFSAEISAHESNVISIHNWDYIEGFDKIHYRVKINSKSTIDSVLASMQGKEYKSLLPVFEKLIPKSLGLVYPTTYGIGISIFGTPQKVVKSISESIESVLASLSISYKLEYSDASLVLRVIISQSQENLKKI